VHSSQVRQDSIVGFTQSQEQQLISYYFIYIDSCFFSRFVPYNNNNNNNHNFTMSTTTDRAIKESLRGLDLDDVAMFAECTTRDDEFKLIKRAYYTKARTTHPDKVGVSPESTKAMQELIRHWTVLRDLHVGNHKKKKKEWLFSDSLVVAVNKKTKSKTAKKKKGDDDDEDEDEAFDMSAYYDFDWSTTQVPSYDFYEAAESDDMPIYRVELAKSNRSKCTAPNGSKMKQCAQGLAQGDATTLEENCEDLVAVNQEPEKIAKGEVRCGSLDENSGGYGRWRHLRCWRVPAKVWKGLPQPQDDNDNNNDNDDQFKAFDVALQQMEECVLSGFAALPHSDQRAFVEFCMDKRHWAREIKKKKQPVGAMMRVRPEPPVPLAVAAKARNLAEKAAKAKGKRSPQNDDDDDDKSSPAKAASVPSDLVSSASHKHKASLVAAKEKFVIPRPGVNGASPATVFQGQTFVLTGLFPEVGGGSGLSLGKNKVVRWHLTGICFALVVNGLLFYYASSLCEPN